MADLEDLILRDATGNRPAAGIAGRLFYDTTLEKWQRDTGADWEDCEPAAGMVDAGDVTYTPTVATDWDSDTDPGDVDEALDQLAERVDDLEGAAGGGLYSAYICVQDQKAQNTYSGTFTAGAWRTRDLNTEVADTGSHASVASNQITLAAGTYYCSIRCPCTDVGGNHAKLYDTTGAADLVVGQNCQAGDNSASNEMHYAFISGRFTLSEQSVLEVQHWCKTTQADFGFGNRLNLSTEIYTVAEFWKET